MLGLPQKVQSGKKIDVGAKKLEVRKAIPGVSTHCGFHKILPKGNPLEIFHCALLHKVSFIFRDFQF